MKSVENIDELMPAIAELERGTFDDREKVKDIKRIIEDPSLVDQNVSMISSTGKIIEIRFKYGQ